MNAASDLGSLLRHARWELARHAAALSPRRGATALLLLGLVALLASLWAWHAAQAQRRELALAVVAAPPQPAAARSAAATDAARLQAFADHLPAATEVPRIQAELIDRARSRRVGLAQGSYQATVDAAGGYARVRMVHPVVGESDGVHEYLLESLRTHRTLSLESVQFKRPDAQGGTLEARIQWVLFVRAPGFAANRSAAP